MHITMLKPDVKVTICEIFPFSFTPDNRLSYHLKNIIDDIHRRHYSHKNIENEEIRTLLFFPQLPKTRFCILMYPVPCISKYNGHINLQFGK